MTSLPAGLDLPLAGPPGRPRAPLAPLSLPAPDKMLWPACAFPARAYQKAMIAAAFEQLEQNRSTLVVAATGLGKTVSFAHAARLWPGRVLVLAHREELIVQARDKLRAICPADAIGVEQGQRSAGQRLLPPRIVVASKDTLWRPHRLRAYPPDAFSLVIVDEAHHLVRSNKSYWEIIKYFSQARVLGVTATPDRSDERALGEVFDSVAYVYDLAQASAEDGWLVPIVQQYVTVEGYDLSGLKACRELPAEELDRVMRREEVLHGVAEAAAHYSNLQTKWGSGRPTLVFCASVAHAQTVAEILNRRHAKEGTGMAAAIWDGMDKDAAAGTRQAAIERYRRGEVRYLCNCMILTEGFDAPETRVVVVARPTKSRSLYAQMIGRGTRPHDSIVPALNAAPNAAARKALILGSQKPGVLVIDLVGNSGKHKLVTCPDILGGWYGDDIVEAAKEQLRRQGGRGDVNLELRRAKEAADERERQRRRELILKARLSSRLVDPFDLFDLHVRREPGWMRGKPITDKQRARLLKAGYKPAELEQLSMHRASALIDEHQRRVDQELCTVGQARVLRKYGHEPSGITFGEARQILDDLQARGWPAPESEVRG